MITLKMKTTEAYDATDPVVHLGQEELDFLSQAINLSPRRRSRICTHRSVQELLHEMFVIYSNATYVRANKHLGKDESVFVIRGEADFLFFDDRGTLIEVVAMGDAASGKAYYCRVPQGVFHTIIMRSAETVLFEGTPGPFNPADTLYADWAPPESDPPAIAKYVGVLNDRVGHWQHRRGLIGLQKINDLVLAATDPVVAFSKTENAYLQQELSSRGLDRLRICAHKTGEDRLHEMLMVFSGSTYVRPSLHVDKEESLYFLEGLGTYVFFDDQGRRTRSVPLGPAGSGRSFYCRVPANTYHSLLVESETVLVKETTSGPFRRSDTQFAPWSPDGADPVAARQYVNSLRAEMRG
jgi:cupin fold WbuC family metalloprotein